MNAMIYMRGHPADYDTWRDGGATGWGWDDLLPYFLRSEDNERGASELHGVGGPLPVSDGRSRHVLMDAFVEAGAQAGHAVNDDFNGAQQEGVGFFQLTQRAGMRASAAVAYLHPVLDRPNLEVMTGALCTRVLMQGNRAVGVEVDRGGEVTELRARREVLLAGGAYNSPQLLMLSGIGVASELSAYGLSPVVDLPVGENLQDHVHVSLCYSTDTESLMTAEAPANLELLTAQGRGPLTSNIGEAGGFFRTRSDLSAPDMQLHAAPVMFLDDGLALPTAHAYIFGSCLLTPVSRGKVFLRSLLPSAKPHIVHGYLTADEDCATMVEAVRRLLDIAEQPALTAHRTGALRVPESESDDDLLAFVRSQAHTLFHPSGTCAIGSVVDAELKVYGLDGLRVVDASVMPTVVRGNTDAPTIAIAERAADLVLGRTPPARWAVEVDLPAARGGASVPT